VSEEIKKQILELVANSKRSLSARDIARSRGIDADPAVIKKLITELVNEGKLEYTSFGGSTFLKIAGKE
jgi:predicted transcriptional regulator